MVCSIAAIKHPKRSLFFGIYLGLFCHWRIHCIFQYSYRWYLAHDEINSLLIGSSSIHTADIWHIVGINSLCINSSDWDVQIYTYSTAVERFGILLWDNRFQSHSSQFLTTVLFLSSHRWTRRVAMPLFRTRATRPLDGSGLHLKPSRIGSRRKRMRCSSTAPSTSSCSSYPSLSVCCWWSHPYQKCPTTSHQMYTCKFFISHEYYVLVYSTPFLSDLTCYFISFSFFFHNTVQKKK